MRIAKTIEIHHGEGLEGEILEVPTPELLNVDFKEYPFEIYSSVYFGAEKQWRQIVSVKKVVKYFVGNPVNKIELQLVPTGASKYPFRMLNMDSTSIVRAII